MKRMYSAVLAVLVCATTSGQTPGRATDPVADLRIAIHRLIAADRFDPNLREFQGEQLADESSGSKWKSKLILQLPGMTDNCVIIEDQNLLRQNPHVSKLLGQERARSLLRCVALFGKKSVARKQVEWATLVTQATDWSIEHDGLTTFRSEIVIGSSRGPYFSIRPGLYTGSLQIEFRVGATNPNGSEY